tara:strand:- start:298 stop:492 length:195 start_codon:yes stop_codon:yes gene_type:complete
MDLIPTFTIKKTESLEYFRYKYREELDYIFNNYIREFLIDSELPIINIKTLYYDMIKYFYLTSI